MVTVVARLCLLGSPRWESADGTRDLPLDRPASLGYYLAQRGDWVRRTELAYLYSPDADESSGLSNLRKLAHRVRHQGWAEALEADSSRLRLRLPTDVQAFRAALARHDWPAALACYAGPFLEGLSFPDLAGYEDWVELERQDLARAWRSALFEHVHALEERAEWMQAEGWLTRLLRAEPLDEEAVQALMRVLHAAGQSARAEDQFERFRRDLEADIGIEPMDATRALADSLRAARTRPAAALPRTLHNLPAAGGRFVGRAHELEALSRQMAKDHCRLLTVVGLGGMGKTRLALELASRQVAGFADGVWWVPLAEVTRVELLVPSLAAAVGLVFSGPGDPRLQLVNFLRGKSMLLLLDNFEHLLEGGPLLEDLLAQAHGLKLLVTSRVALETTSEWLYDLDGLPCPPIDGDEPLDSFDAVRLFISRAERFSSRFAVTTAALQDIAELARRVEGMPLALELAATWTRGLSVGEILLQLRQGFDLLQTTSAGLPSRQSNLQAILGYSWQLLSAPEQSALARLAVFRGGFVLDAAQHVAGAHLGLLLRFINQALVRRGEDGRYDLHELVRHFAERQLPAADRPEVLARFSEYFEAQLLVLGQAVRSAIEPDTVARCRRELGNILSALEHLALLGQNDRLQASLFSFYAIVEIAGLFKVGIAQIDSLARSLQAQGRRDEHLHGELESVRAYFLAKIGEDEEALRCAQSAIARLERAPAGDFLGIAYGAAGICNHFGGRFEDATAWYGKALAVFDATGNRSEQCRVLNRTAAAMKQLDRYDASNRLYQQALETATACGDLPEQANLLNNYGINFESTGNLDEAIRLYRSSLAISDRIHFLRVKSAALTNLGHVHERRGEYREARAFYEQSLEIKHVLGEPVAIAISLTNLADVLYALGDEAAGHRTNFQAMDQALSAHALLYVARAVWSFSKYFLKAALPQPALLLACFLSKTPEREQWVHDEAEAMIATQAAVVGEAGLRRLRAEAEGLDHHAVADWLRRQPRLALGLPPG